MIAFAFLGLLAIGAAFGVKYLQAQEADGQGGGGQAATDDTAFVAEVSPKGLEDDQFIREPVVSEDGQTAYAGADDNALYAVDVPNNKERWRYPTKGRVQSTPFVDDGVVYVGDDAGFLHAVDAVTGKKKWSDRVGDGPVGSPVVDDGLLVVLTDDGKQVSAFSAEDGDEEWSERANASSYVRPMLFNGFVLVSSIRPEGVVVFQRDDGDFVGQFRTEDPIYATGVIADDWLFVASSNGAGTSAKLDKDTYHVYGFPLRKGTREKPWRFRTSGPNPWPVAAVDGRVYVSSNDGNVYALDATEGTQKWAFSIPEERFGGLAADEESVYVASNPGLVALDATTGKQRWVNDKGGRPRTPSVADNVVVATTDQRLYAVNPESGFA